MKPKKYPKKSTEKNYLHNTGENTKADALLTAMRAILKSQDFRQAAQSIFKDCKKMTGATSGYIALVSKSQDANEIIYLDSGKMRCSVDQDLPMPMRGLREKACRSGEVVVHNDFSHSEYMKYLPPGHVRLENVLFAPLLIKGKVVGLLGLANKQGGFSEDDVNISSDFGELAAIALMNKRHDDLLKKERDGLEERVQERTARMIKVHDALKKSEKKYRMLIEQASDGIFILLDSGRIESVNSTACQMLGYRRKELLSKNIRELIPEQDLEKVPLRIKEVLSGKKVVIERRFRHKSGKFLYVEVSAKKVEHGKLQTIVRDLTERRKAEEELIRSRERLSEAQSIGHIGNWEWNLETNTLFWSEEIYRIFGLSPRRFGANYEAFLNAVHPEDREYVKRSVQESLYGKPYRIEHRIIRPDGTVKTVYESGKVDYGESGEPLRMVGIVQDVTERKEAEKALKDSRAKYAAIVNSFDGFIYICSEQDTLEFMNQPLITQIGRNVLGEKCFRALYGFEVICPWCRRSEVEKGEILRTEMKSPIDNQWYYVVNTPIKNQDGSISKMVMIQNINEKKENELRLILSEKLAALGEMASGIAHEINNPLASISACAEGLLNRIRKDRVEPELFNNYLQIMIEEVARCKNITTSMLSFVSKKSQKKETLEIHEQILKTLELIGFQGRLKHIEVKKDFNTPLSVKGAEGDIRQVLLSILTNAIDSMNDTGTITIETGTDHEMVFVRIIDTGPGIPPDHTDRIFDPFFTTKSDKGGVGLGLAIARKIIEENNGSIAVDSMNKKGTGFIIKLPHSHNQGNLPL